MGRSRYYTATGEPCCREGGPCIEADQTARRQRRPHRNVRPQRRNSRPLKSSDAAREPRWAKCHMQTTFAIESDDSPALRSIPEPGSSFRSWRIARHAPTRSGRAEGPPPPQSSTSPGTTSQSWGPGRIGTENRSKRLALRTPVSLTARFLGSCPQPQTSRGIVGLSSSAFGVVLGGELRDGGGARAGVALERAQRRVPAFCHQQRQADFLFG